jgi:hypothetical protein
MCKFFLTRNALGKKLPPMITRRWGCAIISMRFKGSLHVENKFFWPSILLITWKCFVGLACIIQSRVAFMYRCSLCLHIFYQCSSILLLVLLNGTSHQQMEHGNWFFTSSNNDVKNSIFLHLIGYVTRARFIITKVTHVPMKIFKTTMNLITHLVLGFKLIFIVIIEY